MLLRKYATVALHIFLPDTAGGYVRSYTNLLEYVHVYILMYMFILVFRRTYAFILGIFVYFS